MKTTPITVCSNIWPVLHLITTGKNKLSTKVCSGRVSSGPGMTGLANAPERWSPWEPLSASVPLTTGHPAQFPLKHVFLCIPLLVQSYPACCHDNHQPYKRQEIAHLFRVGSCPEAEQGEPAILCIPLRKGWGFQYFVSRERIFSWLCPIFKF